MKFYKCSDEVTKNLIIRTVTGQIRNLILRKLTDTGNSSNYKTLLLLLKERYNKPLYAKNILRTFYHSKVNDEEIMSTLVKNFIIWPNFLKCYVLATVGWTCLINYKLYF